MITRRARASRAALLASVPLLALVTLAAGCGTVTTPQAGGGTSSQAPPANGSPTATPTLSQITPTAVPTTTGGSVAPGQQWCANWPANAAHGTLPTSFVPVAVLRCVEGYQTIPGKGQWQTATLERANQGLATLIAALRAPAGHRAPGVMCPDIAMLPPQIVLIDSAGNMIIPRLPLSGCGLVQQQVLAALAALPWFKVSVRLIAQMQTQAEVGGGCTSAFKDPFLLPGTPKPSPGGVVYPRAPSSLRICVYSANGSGSQFLRGTTITGTVESSLLAGLTGARRTAMCGLPHSSFAVVGGNGSGTPVVYVELGGCNRVLRYETGSGPLTGVSTGQASPQAIAIIEAATRPKP
jgi:hypothetical protein